VTASNEIEPCMSLSEIRNALKAAPSNKAPGSDNIAAELIKAAEEIGVKWLHRLF
jgi:type III secretion system FlhB-like substrate exporter